ncbi:MAG: acyl-CoA thioesterase [Flavobacteriaceae bacterium]
MEIHTTEIRVRYGETDQMGVVYHGNYAQYLEVSRVEWLRSLDISYKKMEDDGIMLPVVNLNIFFKKPAVYDEVLSVKTKLRQKPGLKITIDQEIFNENGDLITTSEITLVFVNMKSKRPMSCPDHLLKKLGF